MGRLWIGLAAGALLAATSASALAQGAPTSAQLQLAKQAERLKPGQWVWAPQIAPKGPVLVYVDLGRQRATVYRNGVRIGVSTISSGKPGYATPTGVFTILEKDMDHRSRTYDNAPMPYQQRLTWMGVAMHAGNLPGFPASHGCVRLPMEFAKKLFTVTPMGGTVVIAGGNQDPVKRAAAGVLAPAMAGVTAPPAAPLSPEGTFTWNPERGADRPGVDHRLHRRPAGGGVAQRGRNRAGACVGPGGDTQAQVMTLTGGTGRNGFRSGSRTSPRDRPRSSAPSGSSRCICLRRSSPGCGR